MEKKPRSSSQDPEVRKGTWTVVEDLILRNYIAKHGKGCWDSLAKAAGLKRTGKSCRLRWLNYLRPDVRRGNITPEEQLLIMELHATWGNKWSKIAKQLPGRTDNEIKNFWRTKVQKRVHVEAASASATAPNGGFEADDPQTSMTRQMMSMDLVGHVEPAVAQPYSQSTSSTLPSYQIQDHYAETSPLTPPVPIIGPLNEAVATDTAWWSEEDFWFMQLFNED